MARIGVDYDQVVAAALELSRLGQTITVDNVRATLGGTGSKSTIAPLLKRWKTENAQGAPAQSLLPADLLQSVQRLYAEVLHRYQAELAAVNDATTLRISEIQAESAALRQQLVERDDALLKLEKTLGHAQTELSDLERSLVTARVEITEREAAQHALEQRVVERSSEIAHLRDQLAQAHRQFDHFQTSTQDRWDKEKALNEARLNDALRANEQMHKELLQAERQLAGRTAQLEQLTINHEQLTSERGQLQWALDTARQENTRYTEAIRILNVDGAQQSTALETLQHAYDMTMRKLADAETQLAVSTNKGAMLEASLAASEQRADVVRNEHRLLLRREAELESELRRARQPHPAPPAS